MVTWAGRSWCSRRGAITSARLGCRLGDRRGSSRRRPTLGPTAASRHLECQKTTAVTVHRPCGVAPAVDWSAARRGRRRSPGPAIPKAESPAQSGSARTAGTHVALPPTGAKPVPPSPRRRTVRLREARAAGAEPLQCLWDAPHDSSDWTAGCPLPTVCDDQHPSRVSSVLLPPGPGHLVH